MSSTTSILGWPYPDPGDSPDVPYWVQQLAEAIEADVSAADKRGVPAGGEKRLTSTTTMNATTSANVPGMAITATLEDGRRYRLKFDGMVVSTVANDRAVLTFLADGTIVKTAQSEQLVTASSAYAVPVERIFTCSPTGDLTPGAHTFQLQLGRNAGSGTLNVVATAATPAQFWLEDAGPYRT